LEHREAGIHTIAVQGLNTGTFDLTRNNWGHKVKILILYQALPEFAKKEREKIS